MLLLLFVLVLAHAQTARDAMKHAWGNYRAHAWGMDVLKPVSGRGENPWGAMGMTILDSLDTLWLMEMYPEFDEARNWVRDHLQFHGDVSVFETCIRALGGLLSAHSLSHDTLFLDKAEELGDKLAAAFRTKTGLPKSRVNLDTGQSSPWNRAVLAEVGTLQLEFRYLAQHAKRPDLGKLAEHVWDVVPVPDDGLYPVALDTGTGQFTTSHVSWGAEGDSYYEYLLKCWIQGGRREKRLRELYDKAIDGLRQQLFVKRGQYVLVRERGGGQDMKMDHLACFLPGLLALGAHHGQDKTRNYWDMLLAKELMHTCYHMYTTTATGLAPENIVFEDEGFRVGVPYYILRPETAESLYVLYHITRDPMYQRWGKDIMTAIERSCRVQHGYGSLPDVRQPRRPPDDNMESFFLAETLKYLHLLETDGVDLKKYVFNTEAHPLRVLHDGYGREL